MKPSPSFQEILYRRTSRRDVLRWGGVGALLAGSALAPLNAFAKKPLSRQPFLPIKEVRGAVDFNSVKHAYTIGHELAKGYEAQVIARWGDPLEAEIPEFDAARLTANSQAKRFGYNNDFTAYLPFTRASEDSYHGLLHVNHEYTNGWLMFADTTYENAKEKATEDQLRIEMAAQGFSVLEIKRDEPGWRQMLGSEYNRRVTANTPIKLSGPAAGTPRLRTLNDPHGREALGTFANCSGGVTPWGTVLTCEENFDGYFHGRTETPEQASHDRYTVGKETFYGWYRIDPRFYVAREPHEPNRFGWVVEYDPYDPKSKPVKRTALGRFKHETATCAIAADGRVVVYSGDDDYFEYLYRFVSHDRADSGKRDILDRGELQVAKFHESGEMEWIALVHGRHGLTKENGFQDQADVLIEARRAGDVVGATKMDRPEGIAVHPHTGDVYVSLTKNPKREEIDAPNPRPANRAGHILRMHPPAGDHGAKHYRWDIFVLAGDPDQDRPRYGRRPGQNDWFGCPDNLAFDKQGRLWVATDGMAEAMHLADGLYAVATEGSDRAAPRCFFRAPKGAEVTGPSFTPDGETLFLSVQHPGEDPGSSFDHPSTRWPDFAENTPPRPAVLAFTRKGGGKIGG